MAEDRVSIDELRGRIHDGECSDPIVLLESLVAGVDPRRTSELYDLIEEISDFGFPDDSDWQSILNLVRGKFKYDSVSISESHSAAKTLAEYLHSKRKQIDINTNNSEEASVPELTELEIETFKQVWNDEF